MNLGEIATPPVDYLEINGAHSVRFQDWGTLSTR